MNLRETAANAGQMYYSTGKPCKRGHPSKRYTSSGNCVECYAVHNKQQALRNKSLVEARRANATGRLDTFTRYLPIEWHASLEHAVKVIQSGTLESKARCLDLLNSLASLELSGGVRPPPPRNGLTLADLKTIFTVGADGKINNLADFQQSINIAPSGSVPPCYLINGLWYDLEDLANVWQKMEPSASPRTLPKAAIPIPRPPKR